MQNYTSIFNDIPVALALTDETGRFINVNDQYCEIHEFSRNELIGKTPLEAGILSYDMTQHVMEEFINSKQRLLNLPIIYTTKTKKIRYALLSANPVSVKDSNTFLITVNDITGQKIAEQEVSDTLVKLRQITDNVPGMVYEYRLSQNGTMALEFASNGTKELYGYDPDDLVRDYSLVRDAIHPEDREALMKSVMRSYETFSLWEYEFRVITKEGILKWVYGRSVPYRKTEEGDVFWIGTVTDVTSRKLMELDKIRSDQRLMQTIELTPNMAIQWFNRNGEVKYWNKASEFLYGFSKEEALGKTLDQLIHTKEEAEGFLRFLKEIEDTGKPIGPYESPVKSRSGELKTVLATTFMIPGEDDEPTFVCMDIDISDKKRLEAETNKISAFHKAILDNSGYPIIATDLNGTITHFNLTAQRMLGYTSEEMVGKQNPLIFHDLNEVKKRRQEISEEFGKVFENDFQALVYRSLINVGNDYEYTYVCKDGSTFPVLLSITAMRNSNDELVGFLGVAADLTERQEAEERLMRKNEELTKINAELDRFVYSASHDLRAPVTSMLGLIEVAKNEKNPEVFRMYLDKQHKTMVKMDEFIHEIVNFSRNGRLKVSSELIDLSVLINDIYEQYGYLENASKISKNLKIDLLAPFFSDKQRVNIIFSNLISNGLKYADLTKSNPYIDIQIVVNNNEARIVFSDNGEGIRQEYQKRVFDMFYRATYNSKGSGLGLYIVKEVLEKLDGSIQLNSEYGKGTSFVITIPNRSSQK